MGKKQGRPKGDRDDVTVKLDRRVAARVRNLATEAGITIAEYLSDLVADAIREPYAALVKKLQEEKG